MRNLGGCICGRKKFVKYVTFGRIQSALTYANIPHNAAETCSHIRKCYVYTCDSKMAAYEQLADNVRICCRFIVRVLHIRFLRDAALFSIRIIAEIYAYSIDFFFKTQICDRQNFSIFVETLTIMYCLKLTEKTESIILQISSGFNLNLLNHGKFTTIELITVVIICNYLINILQHYNI